MTCGVLEDGEAVRLDLKDRSGRPVSLQFPIEQAEALVMTLPQLLTRALRLRTGNEDARCVFPLGQWLVEAAAEEDCLIVTLKTVDGFEVSFGVPFDTGRALGWALSHDAEPSIGVGPPTTN
jgi:hypothetical protein